MLKGKLFVIVMMLAVVSGLLAARSSHGKDTLSAAERPADNAAQVQEVMTNVHPAIPVPNTGETGAESVPADTDARRLWSGEVFLSDNGYPDPRQQTRINQEQVPETACISEESESPRRHGGCAE